MIRQHWRQGISALTTARLLGISEWLVRQRRQDLAEPVCRDCGRRRCQCLPI